MKFNTLPVIGEYRVVVPKTFDDTTRAWAQTIVVEIDVIGDDEVSIFSAEYRSDEPAITATLSKPYEVDIGLVRPDTVMYFEHTSGVFFVSVPAV